MSWLADTFRAIMAPAGKMQPGAFSIGGGRAFEAGNWGTRELGDWHPSTDSADDEILASRDLLVARARDLYRNHPVIHGAVNKLADRVIGNRVLLNAQPMYEQLRRDLNWAIDWALVAQSEFKAWGYSARFEADAGGTQTIGQIARTAFVGRMVDGECIAVIRNKLRAAARYTTCVELIDPDRLSNPQSAADGTKLQNGNTLYAGIEFSAGNEPVAYHIRVRHPKALAQTAEDIFKWIRIERFSPSGKPQVVHSFRVHRPNQRRGVSGLAAVIKRVRMNDNYDVAELEAALFDAINAGFVTSPYPTSEVAAAVAPDESNRNADGWSVGGSVAYRMENAVKLKGVRMIHGLPGESFNWKQPARPAANYPAFKGAGQHDMAAGLGMSYPGLSEDWAAINYSSGRVMENEKQRGHDSVGEEFGSQFLSPIYDALLEEAIAIGTIKMPGGAGKFYANRSLIAFGGWLRPGRGIVDPLKEEQAADIAIHGGRSNTAIECAQNGRDYYDVLRGQAEDKIVRAKLGLPEFIPMKIAQTAGGSEGDGGEGGGTADDRDGDGQANEDQQKKPQRSEQA